jgi:hypothetical protein
VAQNDAPGHIQMLAEPRRPIMKSITINFDLPEDQAFALAKMCNRLSYEDAERFASRFDGGREREAILDATTTLQRALRDAGIAPR